MLRSNSGRLIVMTLAVKRIYKNSEFARDLIFTLALDFMIAVIITIIASLRADNLSQLVFNFIGCFVVANCIGILMLLTFTYLGTYFSSLSKPFNWITLIGAILVATVIGCMLGGIILGALNFLDWKFYWAVFYRSIWFSALISLVIGVSISVHEGLRYKLEATSLRLREKELAEERARKLAIEARLSSLESRIHPHFLFNTLNSISALIQEDPPLAERLVERLAALLRFSLDSNQHSTVPLGQEMKIVGDYLEIESARFGEKLRYSIRIPKEAESVEVPPLSVQTLVENCLKHAISSRREGGEIHVGARVEDDLISIEVCDDGPGFTDEAIAVGHGLDNLQSRLAALFDDRAALDISTRGDQTVVTITLPRIEAQAIAAV
jgi:two-component system, LytTR family, sensor histidine kinase AlgZ